MIVGITGLHTDPDGNTRIAGAGKDAAADRLVEKHKFVRIGLADPLKRICQDVFQFTDEQLWGPSHLREAVDRRYPHGAQEYRTSAEHHELAVRYALMDDDPESATEHQRLADAYAKSGWLSPRVALQTLGTEWGRWCYSDIWMEYGLRVAKRLEEGGCYYNQMSGLRTCATVSGVMEPRTNAVFSDVRFYNEYKCIKAVGGKLIRVKRSTSEKLVDFKHSSHASETQLITVDDSLFDYVIDNNDTLATLALMVDRMMDVFTGRLLPYDEAQADVPPFLRKR